MTDRELRHLIPPPPSEWLALPVTRTHVTPADAPNPLSARHRAALTEGIRRGISNGSRKR